MNALTRRSLKTKMKTVYPKVLLIALMSLLVTSVQATNYSTSGGNQNYSLNSGDTLRINAGTYSGSISNLPYGAVILIADGAKFRPGSINFWTPAGKIINYGTVQFNFGIGVGGNFSFENFGAVAIQGDLSFYSGNQKTWTNKTGSSLIVSGALALGSNTSITNNSTIKATNTISLYEYSSTITNSGIISTGGDFNSNGQLINENKLEIAGNLNQWSGTLKNTGAINQSGVFNISTGITYVNDCRLITKGGINNNGTLVNNGLVWAGTSNTSDDQFTNSGTVINARVARLRTRNFTNYGTFTGGGFVYATGQTTLGQYGVMGTGNATNDSIRVYDVTRTNTQIFDNQWGTVNPNTVYAVFAAPDSIEIYDGCSAAYRAASSGTITLPVKWNYFTARSISSEPVLNWSAEYEQGMVFSIQRSYDNVHFTGIHIAEADASAAYSFSDRTVDRHQATAYYRIKATSAVDGEVKYSETRAVKLNAQNITVASIYPNPTTGAAAISYAAGQTEQITIRIRATNGQQVFLKNVVANSGSNRFELSEIRGFNAGIYFVELIKGNNVVAAEKLVKQ